MNKRIFLVLENLNETNKELPETYTIRRYQPRDKQQWLSLMVDQGVIETDEDAVQAFEEVYMKNLQWTKEWLWCVVDSSDLAISFCSISLGNHTPSLSYRLHFVATDKNHQRKGLSQVLLSRLIKAFTNQYPNEKLYVVTQPIFKSAISLYRQLGFVPTLLQSSLVSIQQQQDYWSMLGINL